MAWKPRRLWATMTAARRRLAATVAVLALAAFACGDAEPPPAPVVSTPAASAQRPAPTPAPTPEPLIDRSQAAPVRVGESVGGELDTHGDFDLFRFQAEAGRWYQIDAALISLGDSLLELYDSDGQLAAYSDNYPGQDWAARILWRAPTAGDYYAKVSSPHRADSGTYRFSAVAVDIPDEHGDGAGDATDIDVGEVVESALEHRADSDWFRFQAAEGAIYEIYTPETAEDDYNHVELWLYDSRGETLNSSYWTKMTAQKMGGDGRVYWKATESGDHYVKVQHWYSGLEMPYSLIVALSDVVDDHHDDSMAATPISVGAAVGGSIDYMGDSDCFRFRAEGGRTYRIDATGETLWSTQAILYGADGAPLASERSPDSHDAPGIVWKAPESGDYYIRVGSAEIGFTGQIIPKPPGPPCESGYILPAGTPGTYILAVAEFSVPDDYPDDAPASIALGHAVSGALEHPNDVDNFSFEAEKGRFYRIRLTGKTLTDVWARLSGDGGTSLVEYQLVWKAPSGGTYGVSVSSYSGDTGTYKLEVLPKDTVDDHANHRDGDPTRVALGETATGAIDYTGDRDVFVFPAESGKFYSVIQKTDWPKTVIVDIREPSGYVLEWRVYNPGDHPSLWFVWQAPESGDYHMEVYPHHSRLELAAYSFAVELADFSDDHANDKENATRIAPGETIEGSVDYAGDKDFFVFQAEAGREYAMRAEPSGMGNIWMQVHDFRQGIAVARDKSGSSATLRWTAPDSRDYYIDATAHEKEIGSYRLTLE